MQISKFIPVCVMFILAYGCTPTAVKRKTSVKHDEDLSHLRKSHVAGLTLGSTHEKQEIEIIDIPDDYEEIEPVFDIGEEIDSVLRIMEANKAEVNRVNGFTIQVFSGKDREKAFYARDKVYTVLDGKEPTIRYYQPNYQVKVGEYFTQLDALEDFARLKESFGNALIIPFRIPISHID